MATRYYSQNDRDFMDRVNNELVGDLPSNQDGIINQTIVIYQHAIQETKPICREKQQLVKYTNQVFRQLH